MLEIMEMKTYYLIRLDDACPQMNQQKWQRMEDILDKYGIKPLVGIIPANADSQTIIEDDNDLFWGKARLWEKKGWCIALHGYNHVCTSDEGMKGLNPFWERSEFAGLSLDEQREKIRKGYKVLRDHGFEPKYFFAPSHTFDENTLEALRLETSIRVISDTIGRYPYKRGAFYFIPQISGHCSEMPFKGIYTFCFHPNVMDEKGFNSLESFIQEHQNYFVSFNELSLNNFGNKMYFDVVLSKVFFIYRRIRGLK